MFTLIILSKESTHVPTPIAVIENAPVFEYLIGLDERRGDGPPVTYEKLEQDLKDHTGLSMTALAAPAKNSFNYEEQWKSNWRRFLENLTTACLHHFCKSCYVCSRGAQGIQNFAQLKMVRLVCHFLNLRSPLR